LHESNGGKGYFDPGWQVLRQESDGSLAVTKGNLRLHIERDRHLQLAAQSAAVGDAVKCRVIWFKTDFTWRSAMGPRSLSNPDSHPQTVRVYFNLSPEGAVAVMKHLTRQLNEATIPFTFGAI